MDRCVRGVQCTSAWRARPATGPGASARWRWSTQVHHTLGRHRADDHRHGWISGLDEAEGEAHPTAGGLRIGKPLPERAPGEPLDERREWDRDGQYFHYLTRWMHALDQVARATGEARYNQWARELDATAFRAFTYVPAPPLPARRMHWKMSIDLSRPLVASMGQHDPLDGYLTTLELRATAASLASTQPDLAEENRAYAAMVRRGDWATDDPLGIGGLLVDAWRVQQLSQQGVDVEPHLVDRLLDAARSGLALYIRGGDLQLPARYRLAFRELGLAIGLHAVERMQAAAPGSVRNSRRSRSTCRWPATSRRSGSTRRSSARPPGSSTRTSTR